MENSKSQEEQSCRMQFSSVQSFSRVWFFVTPWMAARQAFLSISNSRNLLKPMSIESVMPSRHLILCHPLLLPPSIFPSIKVFSNESVLHIRWPKVLELQLQHQSFQWIFRTDLLWDRLVGSPCSAGDSQKSLQHHSSKTSTLWHSAFFIVQLSYPYHTWLLEKP